MNIVVLVKQVPDTEAERKLSPADNTVDRASVDPVINYIDEFAIEEGLRLKEAHGGEVTILTVGPERATESIRKALSMGADKAVHVSDDAIHGSDAIATAKVLAKALGTIEWDVAIAGSEATLWGGICEFRSSTARSNCSRRAPCRSRRGSRVCLPSTLPSLTSTRRAPLRRR